MQRSARSISCLQYLLIQSLALLAAGLVAASSALAQHCVGMASAPTGQFFERVGLRLAQLQPGQARITFIGHSTFQIDSPQGVSINTDYNDYVRAPEVPDIATMNIAHDTHYSEMPDPSIKHVLRGWNPNGGPAHHQLRVADVLVRNVPTNIRTFAGETQEYGNSIFIFEVAGLCIAHLGHLHHTLTTQQIGQIGQMDVVMVPVDGGFTLDLDGLFEVLKALKAQLVIPMHMFSEFGLERFLQRARASYEVVENPVPTIVVSRATLPTKPKVMVLPGR